MTNTKGARIINVSSGAHKSGNINFDDLTWEKRKYSAWKAYGDSKIANLYFTFALTRRFKENSFDTLAVAAHPGWTATDLQRHSGVIDFLNAFFAQDAAMGALPTLRVAFDEDAEGGDYFGPEGFMEMRGYPIKVEANNLAKDVKIADKLWTVSEELTGVKFDFNKNFESASQSA